MTKSLPRLTPPGLPPTLGPIVNKPQFVTVPIMQSSPQMLPSRPRPLGQTFQVAVSLLGGLALIQVSVFLWWLLSGTAHRASLVQMPPAVQVTHPHSAPSIENPALEAQAKPSAAASMVAGGVATTSERLSTPVPVEQTVVDAERRLVESIPKPTPVIAQREMTPENRLNDLLNLARTLRDRGDTSTALTRLREAQMLYPQNLQIISEMAITYEKMALIDKAIRQWRRIYEMGDKAGIYFAAAEAKLSALQLPTDPNAVQQVLPPSVAGGAANEAPPETSTGISIPGTVLSTGNIRTVDDTGNTQLLRNFKLRIPIVANPEHVGAIDVSDVVLQIYFYDQLSGGSVVETNANVSSAWASAPIDWSSSEPETLEVTYAQAEEGLAGPPDRERRSYFGYAVRVYYQGELNGVYCEPRKLLQLFPPPKTLSTTSSSSDLPQ